MSLFLPYSGDPSFFAAKKNETYPGNHHNIYRPLDWGIPLLRMYEAPLYEIKDIQKDKVRDFSQDFVWLQYSHNASAARSGFLIPVIETHLILFR